jgi:putative ATP-dependent endonuclease of the OLD family
VRRRRFTHLKGIRNFVSYAAEETLDFLSRRQVQMWFIIDRDERNEKQIKSLEEKLKGKATLFALRKREIENYLLSPRAITEFIKLKSQASGRQIELNVSEVDSAISESAESLKQFVVNKHIAQHMHKPIYPSHELDCAVDEATLLKDIKDEMENMKTNLGSLRGKLDECIKEKKAFVESNWGSNKLDMIPGDLLLDSVCKKFGYRFRKMQDSKRLATLMTENEIDEEIKNIIGQIKG